MKVIPAIYANRFGINIMGTPEDNVKLIFGEAINGEDIPHVAVAMSRHNAVQLVAALTNALNITDGALRDANANSNVTTFRPNNLEPQ